MVKIKVSDNIGISDASKKERAEALEKRMVNDIPLAYIRFDTNVRREYNEASIAELAASIEKHGLIQPIILAEAEAGQYIVQVGHRRFLAVKSLGLQSITAFVRPPYNDAQDRRTKQLIENVQREDLTPPDLELSVKDMLAGLNGDHSAVALALGKSESWVRKVVNAAVIRESLPADVQAEAKDLSYKDLASVGRVGPADRVEAVSELLDEKKGRGSKDGVEDPDNGKRRPKTGAVKPELEVKVRYFSAERIEYVSRVEIPAEAEELLSRAMAIILRS